MVGPLSKNLQVNGFKWLDTLETSNKINEEFIKYYNENDNKGYILEVDVKYPKRLHKLQSDLPFLSERMEVNKCKKLVCNLFSKEKYVAHIYSLKQALNHGLKLKSIWFVSFTIFTIHKESFHFINITLCTYRFN